MKKFVSLVVVCVILALSIGAIAEPPPGYEVGFGTLEEMGGWIAVYCNTWDRIFGTTFKSDLSFDESKYSIVSTNMTDEGIEMTVDIDGVTFDVLMKDTGMNVVSMTVPINDKEHSEYALLARSLAVVCAAFYEPAETASIAKDRFMSLIEQYIDGLESFTNYLSLVPHEKPYSQMTLILLDESYTNNFPQTYFCSIDGDLFFSTRDLATEDGSFNMPIHPIGSKGKD